MQEYSIRKLGEGLDNLAYELNGELVLRFSREGDLVREAELLKLVKDISPLPVPEPIYADGGCMAYPKLPGRPLEDAAALPRLAEFLTALHSVPAEAVGHLVEVDHLPLADWRGEAVENATKLGYSHLLHHLDHVPAAADELVFSHNDLGTEHVLADGATITGVIDWTDAAICDPAYDYGLLYRDLGADALGICPEHLRERAVFYARCTIFEDLAYGRDARASLAWLFPGHA